MGTPVSQVYKYFLARISTDEWIDRDEIDIYEQEWRDILDMARFYFRYPRKNTNIQLVEYEIEPEPEPEKPTEPPEEPIEPPDEPPEEPLEPPEEPVEPPEDGEEPIEPTSIMPMSDELEDGEDEDEEEPTPEPQIELVEEFVDELTNDEIQILAILMKQEWLRRCIASIDVLRQGYDERDWSQGSRANHLDKLVKYGEFTNNEVKRALFEYSRSIEFKPFPFKDFAGKK